MTTLRAAAFAALLVALPAVATAQDGPPAAPAQDAPPQHGAPAVPPPPRGRPLTLRDAMRRARDHAPQVLAALARVAAARAQLDVTRSALWPTLSTTVSGSASVSQSTAQTFSGVPVPAGVSTSVGAVGSVDGRWTIWDFGRTDEASRAARFEETATRQDLADVRRTAMQAVAAAFFGVLADQQLVSTDEAIVAQRRAELDITHGLVEVGSHPPIEETRANVALSAAELDLRIVTGTLASDTAALAATLAIDPATPLTVVPPGPLDVSDDPVRAAEDAVRARPDVVAAQRRVEEAEASVRLARAAWMPTLSASLSATGRLTDVPQNMTPFVATGTVAAGVSFTAPLVDESIPARTRAAEAQLEAQQEAVEVLLLSVRSTAVQAAVAARNARAAVAQGEELARQAAANLEQARGRYETGAASMLELVDAEAADASARIAVVRLRASLSLAEAQLLSATGRLDALAR